MFPNLYLIKSVIILDRDGRRLFSKYYPSAYGAAVATAPDDSNATRALFPDTHAKQDAFERLVYDKTKGCLLGQAILLEDQLVVYKASADIIFYVAAVLDANELLINAVLEALHDTCLSVLARALPVSATSTVLPSLSDVDKKLLMDNYDVLAVIVDELIDNGIIMELDAAELGRRVPRRSAVDGPDGSSVAADQAFSQAIETARYWKNQWLKS